MSAEPVGAEAASPLPVSVPQAVTAIRQIASRIVEPLVWAGTDITYLPISLNAVWERSRARENSDSFQAPLGIT
jgi:hypothetical protein